MLKKEKNNNEINKLNLREANAKSRHIVDLNKIVFEIEKSKKREDEKTINKLKIRVKNGDFTRDAIFLSIKKLINKKYYFKVTNLRETVERLAIFNLIFGFEKLLKIFYKFGFRACYQTGWCAVLIAKKIIKVFKLNDIVHAIKRENGGMGHRKIKFAQYKFPLPHFRYNWATLKSILLFFCFLLAFSFPIKIYSFYTKLSPEDLKGRVLGVSEEAISSLKNAAKSASELDLAGAGNDFGEAGKKFSDAENEILEINSLLLKLAGFLPDRKFRLASYAKEFLRAGELTSLIGKNYADAF